MSPTRPPGDGENPPLNLRCGEWVEVRSPREIAATLDGSGALDRLPFMPEMLQYCGRRFQVGKRAEKACDTVRRTGARRMLNAVHLADLRCDGSAHDGCQAGCRLFWKEAWLRRVSGPEANSPAAPSPAVDDVTLARLQKAARQDPPAGDDSGEPLYRCQATEVHEATLPMAWWDFRQYWRDYRCGNVGPLDILRAAALFCINTLLRRMGRAPVHDVSGPVKGRTPAGTLDLVPGEEVEVRSRQEILATLNVHGRNRGLSFDPEMIRYCGRRFRVLRRVEKIVDERTARMIRMPADCIILDGAVCVGDLSSRRLFCQRAIYPYWRELWLKRVEK